MNSKIRNIFFFLGIAAVVIMCFTFDVSFAELWHDLQRAGYWFFAILVLWGFLYAMNALTWRVILQGSGDCQIPFLRLFKLTVSGFALNYATPVGLLGGEPYKIMELTPYVGVQRATSSVVLFAMTHIFCHFLFWLTSIVVFAVLVLVGNLECGVPVGIILFLATLFCFGGLYLFISGYKNGMVVRLIALVGKIPGLRGWANRFSEKRGEDLHKIDEQISQLHSQRSRNFYLSVFLEFVGRMFQCFEIFFILLIFGAEASVLTFAHSFLILSFTSLFANLLFFLPLQLGGREGGFAMSTAQMGLTNEIGIFISLICRVRELFWTAVGMILMKLWNEKK